MEAAFIIKVALTAYSAVSAVKALKEGNIMGAVMGGFGAYMGLSNLGAFGSATAGDATALTAAADTTVAEGLSEAALGDTFTGMEAATGFTTGALGDTGAGLLSGASTAMEGAAVSPVLADGATPIGGVLDLGGGLSDTFTSGLDSVIQGAKDFGNEIVGGLKSVGDGTFMDEAGSIFDQAGKLVGGTGNLMKLGGMGLNYLGKEKALKAKEDAAEQGYQRSVAEAARKRKSVGSAPGYVYDFGRKEGVV